jgi:hypothetical protein
MRIFEQRRDAWSLLHSLHGLASYCITARIGPFFIKSNTPFDTYEISTKNWMLKGRTAVPILIILCISEIKLKNSQIDRNCTVSRFFQHVQTLRLNECLSHKNSYKAFQHSLHSLFSETPGRILAPWERQTSEDGPQLLRLHRHK